MAGSGRPMTVWRFVGRDASDPLSHMGEGVSGTPPRLSPHPVMAGLGPATHALPAGTKGVGPRVKPEDDGGAWDTRQNSSRIGEGEERRSRETVLAARLSKS